MKKKSLRKVLAASVAAMLMCAPMMAMNTAYAGTITIADATANNTYEAYKIFSGTVSDGKLTNIAWDSQIEDKSGDLLNLLADSDVLVTGTTNDFAEGMSAEDVATKLQGYGALDDAKAIEFARIVANFMAKKGITATKTINSAADTTVDDGYYLVINKTTNNKALSRSILKVAGTASITGKVDFPTIDKQIDTAYKKADGVEVNVAAIGDTIPYVIKSDIPDMRGYSKYYYIINDTMDPGLTFNNDIKIGIDVTGDGKIDNTVADGKQDVVFVVDTDYKVVYDSATNKIKIVFIDFINNTKITNDNKSCDIITTYSADLNEKAELGTVKDEANLNKVNLVYSNNPNYDYKGTNDTNPDVPPESPRNPGNPGEENPDDDTPDTPYNPDEPGTPGDPTKPGTKFDEPVGITPYEDVVTYTTNIDLVKVNGSGDKLAGVKFKLENASESEALNKVVVYSNEFVENTEGTYYKLNDGTYTETAPTEETASSYASTETKYELKAISKVVDSKAASTTVEGTTTSEGKLNFSGLTEGKYILTETQALPGYNSIAPMTLEIKASVLTKESCTWSYKKDGDEVLNTVTIINNQGSILPSTGGIGTTIFYVSGGLLVLGSAVLLVTKKRMSLKEEQ